MMAELSRVWNYRCAGCGVLKQVCGDVSIKGHRVGELSMDVVASIPFPEGWTNGILGHVWCASCMAKCDGDQDQSEGNES